MRNKFKPKHLILSALICLFSQPALSAPLVEFNRFRDNDDKIAERFDPNAEQELLRGHPCVVKRFLGMSQQEFQSIMEGVKWKSSQKYNYQILNHILEEFPSDNNFSYIFHNNKVAGYLLMGPLYIEHDESYPVSPIRQMKQLPHKAELLAGIKIPESVQLDAYEKKHNGFIERYIFARFIMPREGSSGGGEVYTLLVDAYFPEVLEQTFTKDMQKYIKGFVKDVTK